MKYIKSILEHLKSYKKFIANNIYNDARFIEANRLYFTEKEVNYMKNNLKKNFKLDKNYSNFLLCIRNPIKPFPKYYINKYTDEWYIIRVTLNRVTFLNSQDYVCDQWSSVLEYLKDNDILEPTNEPNLFKRIIKKFKDFK